MENKIKPSFESVKADEKMKSDVIQFLNEQTDASSRRNPFYNRKQLSILVAAVCLVIVFVSAFQYQTIYTQAAYIELSGPTRLAISLNKKNEVLKLVGLNESGTLIADNVDVKHLSYEEALDTIVNCDAYQENADTNAQVEVTVDCDNEQCAKSLEQKTKETCEKQQRQRHQNQHRHSK